VFGGMGASAPIFVIHSIHTLPIQNSDEPEKTPHVAGPPLKNVQ
jgi:hypothetical protein